MDVFRLAAATLSENLPARTRFRLKAHPVAGPARRLAGRIGMDLPEGFEIVDGDFGELLEEADVVMSNQSSTGLEALAKGVPVIVAGSRSGLTQNPIPPSVDGCLWRLCHGGREAAAALRAFAGRTAEEKDRDLASARKVCETYFEPVTRETVRRFLRLEER